MDRAQGSPRLEVRGLVKGYRKRIVLRRVDLVVAAGEAVAVIGRNGAGKSTLLGCVTGDRLPDAGEVRVCGVDPFSDPVRAAECMGFVPEQPFLYGELTVGEILDFVADARGLPRNEARREGERLLSLLGMAQAESLVCRELSQGMGRKVALTIALLHRPQLIVLDEAFNGLDQASTERLTEELDARRSAGAALLMSSHDLGFLARHCQRGLLLAPEGAAKPLEGEAWQRWTSSPALEVS
ncbi:MAG TPA: ABC transporter ATP-binding protein [Longimicrobiaceae bacterium]